MQPKKVGPVSDTEAFMEVLDENPSEPIGSGSGSHHNFGPGGEIEEARGTKIMNAGVLHQPRISGKTKRRRILLVGAVHGGEKKQ